MWSNGSTTSTVTGLTGQPTDTLIVAISDSLGCTRRDTAIVNCVTGIAENNAENDFTISPNPTSGVFNVQMSKFENVQMNIYNMYGECIYQHISIPPSSGTNQQIDLSKAPSGIYFLQVKTAEGVTVKKLVISK